MQLVSLDGAGAATPAGLAAAALWAREDTLRARYLDNRPEEAGRIAASERPIWELLPRDVIAELERSGA